MESNSVPATICIFYTDYESLLREGRLSLGDDTVCLDGACAQIGGRLRLTKSTVTRPVFFLRRDAYGEWTVVLVVVTLAIARCDRCRSRIRVLPCDILPLKRYSLPIIEHAMAAYATGSKSLRKVVWKMLGETTPAHTSLHAWTEGAGAHALGRSTGDVPGSMPHSALSAETEARRPETRDIKVPPVDERRYRSEARRERLAAVALLLAVAGIATGVATGVSTPGALASWCALALVWGLTSPLLFRSGLRTPRSEHCVAESRARSPPK